MHAWCTCCNHYLPCNCPGNTYFRDTGELLARIWVGISYVLVVPFAAVIGIGIVVTLVRHL